MIKQILVIQTASIGDAILGTAVIEKLHIHYPEAQIDYLVKKGIEPLLSNHPFLNNTLVWNKKENKNRNLIALLCNIRKTKYDLVITLQRFFSSGLLTAFSGAKITAGFDKNPLSCFFTIKCKHQIGSKGEKYLHEVGRNQSLISSLTDCNASKPRLYPSERDYSKTKAYTTCTYMCVAPASLWYTKQYPIEKWCDFLSKVPTNINIYLLGGPSDKALCDNIANSLPNHNTVNFAGQLSLLESAALMKYATMNYVCDSSPMHLCSSVDAPVTAIFCSTIPEFGFGPLSGNSAIVQSTKELPCRPCGIHGHKECPNGSFECANSIDINELIQRCKPM